MFSTIVFFALFIATFLATAALWGFFLWLGLRWAIVENVTLRGVVVATAVVIAVQLGVSQLIQIAMPSAYAESLVGVLIQVLFAVVLQLGVIGAVFKLPVRQVVQAWLLTLFASGATVLIVVLILRPALYEGFEVPTNSMAPTLLGIHVQAVCAECERISYGSPVDDRTSSSEPARMICDHFHVGPASGLKERTFEGDRVLVAKFLKPRRWDIVVFRLPAQPEVLNTKRLVGLPGEAIQIRDGAVWVDGQKLTPPDHLTELEYLNGIPEMPQITFWGSPERPAVLGKDEYFVLGDFSAESTDSRFWESGAVQHNPFAVPESYIVGVVTHTYWPLDRVRVHR